MTASSPAESRVRRKVREVAREYERAGYRVLVEPSLAERPGFLASFHPDLIAVGDEESVVVEVKTGRGFVRSGEFRELAARVNDQPGWRFELVVTNPKRRAEGEAQPWALPLAERHLAQARELTKTGQSEAALLLLWASIEAFLRRLARDEDVALGGLTTTQLVQQLATEGLLERTSYRTLWAAVTLRNQIAHGIGAEPVDADILGQLLAVADDLREEVQEKLSS